MGLKCMQFEAMEYFELNGYFSQLRSPVFPGNANLLIGGVRATQQAHRNTWNR